MAVRKMIAPIVITVAICFWAVLQTIGIIFLIPELPFWISALGIAIPLAFVALMAYVLYERIKEIQSGVEDDLDNY